MSAIDTTAATTSSSATSATGSSSSTSATSAAADASDRFLKLLVAQMQHQDPLNPMDNAQVTTQMAQISTVSGIEKMNQSIQAMTSGVSQMQALQGVALVGHGVMLEGDALHADASGKAGGGFTIDSAADSVRVDILSGSGALIDTIDLGAQSGGQHAFDWSAKSSAAAAAAASFRVTATAGGTSLPVTQLAFDKVAAVRTTNGQLTLDLAGGGSASYAQIKAFN